MLNVQKRTAATLFKHVLKDDFDHFEEKIPTVIEIFLQKRQDLDPDPNYYGSDLVEKFRIRIHNKYAPRNEYNFARNKKCNFQITLS
jgi:hypothetical protein